MRSNRGTIRVLLRGCPTDLGVAEIFAGEVTSGQASEACVRVYSFRSFESCLENSLGPVWKMVYTKGVSPGI